MYKLMKLHSQTINIDQCLLFSRMSYVFFLLYQNQQNPGKGESNATGNIVIAVIAMVLFVLIILLVIFAFKR